MISNLFICLNFAEKLSKVFKTIFLRVENNGDQYWLPESLVKKIQTCFFPSEACLYFFN